LIRQAASDCDVVGVSVFVNPLQFGANEDLSAYPRDLEADCRLATASGAQYVFAPSVEEMYPQPPATSVVVSELSTRLEGEHRPGHFAGVATVVTKLFALAGPCRAYFGEKDYQQLCVVRRLAADLSLPVEVVGCPTVREPDGLALSSRNVYLSPEERVVAPALYHALEAGAAVARSRGATAAQVVAVMADVVRATPGFVLDYAAVVDPVTFEEPPELAGDLRLLIAARLGRARLIDNMGVSV
jgi:pantoate--beta-alanine ligase